MKKINVFVLHTLIIFIFFNISCNEIIETDISKYKITVHSPVEGLITSNYNQTFWWDKLPGAIKYNLQVVIPSFDSITKVVLDTEVSVNKFNLTLQPGKYTWRILALNGSSSTAFLYNKFTIVCGSLSQQLPLLISPVNSLYTNNSKISFKWEPLYSATVYRVQIDTDNFKDESALFFETTLSKNYFDFIVSNENNYQWRVRAETDTSYSNWSPVRYFTFDKTPPSSPDLISPINNENVSKPVSLQWGSVNEIQNYKLFVFKSDSVSLYNSDFPKIITGNSFSFNLGSSKDKVFWKVSAIDKAGNEGKSSSERSFILK